MVYSQSVLWRLLFTTLQSRFKLKAKEVSLSEWLDRLDSETLKLYDFLRAAGSGREHNVMFANRMFCIFCQSWRPQWMTSWQLSWEDET